MDGHDLPDKKYAGHVIVPDTERDPGLTILQPGEDQLVESPLGEKLRVFEMDPGGHSPGDGMGPVAGGHRPVPQP